MRFICPEPPFVGHLIEWCVLKSGWSAFTLGIRVISQNGSQSCRRAGSFGPRKVGIWCCVLVTDSRMDVHSTCRVFL